MKSSYIPNHLFLAVHGSQPGAWLPLGCLAKDDDGYYFTRTRMVEENSDDWKSSLFGISNDPDWHFSTVPPPFHMRVWNRKRNDRPQYLRWLGLSEEEAEEPMVEMAHSYGRKYLDKYETFAVPEAHKGHYNFCFPLQDTGKLIWGFNCKSPPDWRERHKKITTAILGAHEGKAFQLHKEGDDKVLLLLDGQEVGYCPRAYAPEIQTLMDQKESNLQVVVERVNHDAAPDMMAICRLTCDAPEGFPGFCQSEEYTLVR